MNEVQDDTRARAPVVETPAAPPRLIWLLLPLGVAAGLLVWGMQLGRPGKESMWSVAKEPPHQVAAPAGAVQGSDLAVSGPVLLATPAIGADARDALDVALTSAERIAADRAAPPRAPASETPIPEGDLIAIEPTSPALPSVAHLPAVSAARDIPPEAALVAALRGGQLQPAAPADFERWKMRYAAVNHAPIRQSLGDLTGGTAAYVIRQDFEFPGGLYGAHSALFLVEPGVPFPRGDPGHSMILDLATGACVGFRCLSLRD